MILQFGGFYFATAALEADPDIPNSPPFSFRLRKDVTVIKVRECADANADTDAAKNNNNNYNNNNHNGNS